MVVINKRLGISALWRFSPVISVTAAVVLMLAGLGVLAYGEHAYEAQKMNEVSVQAQILASTVTAALVFDDQKTAQEYVSALRANPEIEAVAVYNENGSLFVSYRRYPAVQVPHVTPTASSHLEANRLIVVAPVIQNVARVGTIYLETIVDPIATRIARYAIVASLAAMGSLLMLVQWQAHTELTKANLELAGRASDLTLENANAVAAARTARRDQQDTAELLAAIVACSDDAIISKTMDGIITTWNQGAVRLFGYSVGEAIGQDIGLIIPLERRAEETGLIARLRRGESIAHYDTVRTTKDGRLIDISASLSPIHDDVGRITGAANVARDIGVRKRHEAELARHVDALERSNKELDDFAYIASHDLKEPLRGLFNNAKFLLEDNANKLDHGSVGRLRRLSYLTQRMETLINDLLYFSRLGRQELAIQPTDLNDVIRDIESMSETSLQEANAEVIILQALPTLRCDKTRIAEVFRNLISNGVKYNDSKTKRIEIGYLDQMQTPTGMEYGVFYVKDNGIGIAEEFYEEIFRIFKRLNAEDDDKRGSGVGLTFVRKIIERHGGRIWVRSSPGEGTIFYLTIKQGEVHECGT
jgi:two-component system, LuxR family, sensor kinase FixL